MLVIVFTFLFVDMFDTVGTLIGCATKADLIKKDGTIANVKQALFADAIGTTVGAMLGTSTVTTYVESSSGISEGGKTGLTALTVLCSVHHLPVPLPSVHLCSRSSYCTGTDPRRTVYDLPGQGYRLR